eukprot:7390375-Prymnesium_polylepis.1
MRRADSAQITARAEHQDNLGAPPPGTHAGAHTPGGAPPPPSPIPDPCMTDPWAVLAPAWCMTSVCLCAVRLPLVKTLVHGKSW